MMGQSRRVHRRAVNAPAIVQAMPEGSLKGPQRAEPGTYSACRLGVLREPGG
jgi:hypothetical protein